jgi:hypothetical protein
VYWDLTAVIVQNLLGHRIELLHIEEVVRVQAGFLMDSPDMIIDSVPVIAHSVRNLER